MQVLYTGRKPSRTTAERIRELAAAASHTNPIDSRVLEYALLSWDLAPLPDTTRSFCAESKPTFQGWGWQRTLVARRNDRSAL
jgi:hypothetical protein